MFKWIVIYLLLCWQCVFAQQDVNSFRITIQDDSLIKVLREYIRIGQTQGLHKDESVLVMKVSDQANPDKAEWFISAVDAEKTDVEKRKKFIPAYVSELDGYPIIIYFSKHPEQFFGYPKSYLDYLDRYVYAKLRKKSVQQRLISGIWKVTFVKGKSPIVLGQL